MQLSLTKWKNYASPKLENFLDDLLENPNFNILISVLKHSSRLLSVHSGLIWDLTRLLLVSAGNFPKTVKTRRAPYESSDLTNAADYSPQSPEEAAQLLPVRHPHVIKPLDN